MVKVKCLKCGNVQDTYAKWFFTCNQCKEKQTIENSLLETKLKEVEKETPKEIPKEIPKEEVRENEDLEIEEEPKKVEKVEENAHGEQFRCPECNSIVEQYGDCTNPECKAEIIWGSDDE